ncbi:bifunctional folylpolyglutamate synthase/dihydrofolate synthase [Salimicrobium halophilum]|uniref:Dihydrofolate synthase/folylpolyglutamate synthase n=1 Tax=Salimicrobium halophilum TaxID=86666 RepID=A0A1G8PIM4_9BACI|nr:folylpolyglutamate synthase/dihydrofolate synthase family protein [Salimicrobium halophilum]SDI92369.1 dihydrofolate synthase / folylpolyglutamate synthase [Salimicrobium halophilum]
MNKTDALDWIHSRSKFKIKPGLERMEWMADKLGHPEKKVPAIHVAGTNGKGSTTSFLRNLLQKQGYVTGTFTSPYITHFNERISINGGPISDEDLIHMVEKVKPLVEEATELPIGEPTEFEVITMMSFLYFEEQAVDVMVIETGLGGLYDSTNIITPALSIITNIGLDHQDILGESYSEIATQKAGIIKEGVPVVSGVEQPEARAVIVETAEKFLASLYQLNEDFFVKSEEAATFVYQFQTEEHYELTMIGEHQKKNASLAVTAIELLKKQGWNMDRTLYAQALFETKWPGRMEVIREEPLTLLDGAHNFEGTIALVETLKKQYADKRILVIYGAIHGKPVKEMIGLIREVAEEIAVVSFEFPKALQKQDYHFIDASLTYYTRGKDAYEAFRQSYRKNDIILCTGSLYFISEIRKYIEPYDGL